jgi:glutaredoxin
VPERTRRWVDETSARTGGAWISLWAVIAILAAPSLVGCGKSSAKGSGSTSASATAAVNAPQPTIVIRDESTGLMFSYITLDGGFQLTQKVADVPYEARDVVRVWSDVSGDGVAGPWVYVADLRTKLGDGTYKVESMAREQFDKLAEERRAKNRAARASASAAPGGGGPGATGDDRVAKKGLPTVIIYGADWCKPCHAAENYLKQKGIPYVHKDVDDDRSAQEEMADKLSAAGIRTRSIPILDVGGKLLVGFEPGALDRAIAEASSKS